MSTQINISRPYPRETCPITAERLDVINGMATIDEDWRAITFPIQGAVNREAERLLEHFRQLADTPNPESPEMEVWSFDIDLTLTMPEDEPGCKGPVPVGRLQELQQQGAVVGTCSDRTPSEQRAAMRKLGFTPDFCIPKEMLRHLAKLLPEAALTHVGDDEMRDRKPALDAGWRHLWPQEALNQPCC